MDPGRRRAAGGRPDGIVPRPVRSGSACPAARRCAGHERRRRARGGPRRVHPRRAARTRRLGRAGHARGRGAAGPHAAVDQATRSCCGVSPALPPAPACGPSGGRPAAPSVPPRRSARTTGDGRGRRTRRRRDVRADRRRGRCSPLLRAAGRASPPRRLVRRRRGRRLAAAADGRVLVAVRRRDGLVVFEREPGGEFVRRPPSAPRVRVRGGRRCRRRRRGRHWGPRRRFGVCALRPGRLRTAGHPHRGAAVAADRRRRQVGLAVNEAPPYEGGSRARPDRRGRPRAADLGIEAPASESRPSPPQERRAPALAATVRDAAGSRRCCSTTAAARSRGPTTPRSSPSPRTPAVCTSLWRTHPRRRPRPRRRSRSARRATARCGPRRRSCCRSAAARRATSGARWTTSRSMTRAPRWRARGRRCCGSGRAACRSHRDAPVQSASSCAGRHRARAWYAPITQRVRLRRLPAPRLPRIVAVRARRLAGGESRCGGARTARRSTRTSASSARGPRTPRRISSRPSAPRPAGRGAALPRPAARRAGRPLRARVGDPAAGLVAYGLRAHFLTVRGHCRRAGVRCPPCMHASPSRC